MLILFFVVAVAPGVVAVASLPPGQPPPVVFVPFQRILSLTTRRWRERGPLVSLAFGTLFLRSSLPRLHLVSINVPPYATSSGYLRRIVSLPSSSRLSLCPFSLVATDWSMAAVAAMNWAHSPPYFSAASSTPLLTHPIRRWRLSKATSWRPNFHDLALHFIERTMPR